MTYKANCQTWARRMTIGLTWRRTARRIKRLKEGVLTISPDYSDRPTPDFLALSLFGEAVSRQLISGRLSPLKWQHINRYGIFILNMKERLPLEPVISATGV